MTTPERAIDRFRLRLAMLLVLKYAVRCVTGWAFLWGGAVLLLRARYGVERLPLLWGLAGLPVALVAALLAARPRLPSRPAVRALLDQRNGWGGLLMAGAECDLGGWPETLPELGRPRVRWRGGRAWTLLAAASLFVLVSFLVPQRLPADGPDRPLNVNRDVEKLTRQIDVLEEEGALTPRRAEALRQRLAALKDDTSGKDPAKTLEALDHLDNVVHKAARKRVETAARQADLINKAVTLADALGKASDAVPPALKEKAVAALAEQVAKAIPESDLARKLAPEVVKGLQDGSIKPEQLKDLAQALKDGKIDLAKAQQLLATAEKLAAKLGGGAAADPEARKQALTELAAQVEKATRGTDLHKKLDAALLKGLKEGSIKPEQLKGLAEGLRGGKADLARAEERLARAEKTAEKLARPGEGLPPKARAEARAELAQLAEKTAKGAGLHAKVDPKTLKAVREGTPTPAQLEELARALGGGKADLAQALEKLHKAGLIDREQLKRATERGPGDGADLVKKSGGSGGPVTGGPLTSEEGVRYKPVVLPPADAAKIKAARARAPETRPFEKPEAGALNGADAGGGAANAPVVLPRYRAAVERYIDRI
jgi:hypothetical protein